MFYLYYSIYFIMYFSHIVRVKYTFFQTWKVCNVWEDMPYIHHDDRIWELFVWQRISFYWCNSFMWILICLTGINTYENMAWSLASRTVDANERNLVLGGILMHLMSIIWVGRKYNSKGEFTCHMYMNYSWCNHRWCQ